MQSHGRYLRYYFSALYCDLLTELTWLHPTSFKFYIVRGMSRLVFFIFIQDLLSMNYDDSTNRIGNLAK
jgi:hypothetical protein